MEPRSTVPTESKLSAADRLSGVLFQFLKLYERLSEDRQEFVAQAEKLEAVLKQMSAAAKAMSEFKPQVGQAVEESLRGATNRVPASGVECGRGFERPHGSAESSAGAGGIVVETV